MSLRTLGLNSSLKGLFATKPAEVVKAMHTVLDLSLIHI